MKRLILLLAILSTILMTGCWDMVEIEDRFFPYSFGVDLSDSENEKISLTITYPNIKAMGKNPTQDQTTYVVNTNGSSIFQASRRLSTEVQGPFYFKHLRVLVMGEDVARDDKIVREVMDGLMRDYIINKKVLIAISEDKAEELLDMMPKYTRQQASEGTLYNILSNKQKSTSFTPEYLSDFIFSMDKKEAAIVPLVKKDGDGVTVMGGGIFKDYKLVGYIDHTANMSIAALRGRVKTEVIDTEYNRDTISFNTSSLKSTKKLIQNEENIKVKFEILLEGSVQAYTLKDGSDMDSEKILKDIEKTIEDNVKSHLMKTIDLLQKEYKADALGIGEYLSKYHPKIWEEVKTDWNNVFAEMDIEVDVKVEIRRRGLVQ